MKTKRVVDSIVIVAEKETQLFSDDLLVGFEKKSRRHRKAAKRSRKATGERISLTSRLQTV